MQIKADRSPVSIADREGEQAIAEVLTRACPGHGYLGEELGARGPLARRFIVDPIDGTRNFVRGIGYWAVLVALEEDGVITAGVIHQPVTGEVYRARRGQGAWLGDQPIRVSAVDRAAGATLTFGTLKILRAAAAGTPSCDWSTRPCSQRSFGDSSATPGWRLAVWRSRSA